MTVQKKFLHFWCPPRSECFTVPPRFEAQFYTQKSTSCWVKCGGHEWFLRIWISVLSKYTWNAACFQIVPPGEHLGLGWKHCQGGLLGFEKIAGGELLGFWPWEGPGYAIKIEVIRHFFKKNLEAPKAPKSPATAARRMAVWTALTMWSAQRIEPEEAQPEQVRGGSARSGCWWAFRF